MEKTLHIAIGSTCSKPGDIKGNLAQINRFAEKAGGCGCDLLLTPELSASGYGGYDEVIETGEEAGHGPVYEALAGMAVRNRLTVLAGFVEQEGGRSYLAHYAVFPGGGYIVQRKHRVTPRENPLCPGVDLYYDDTEEIGHVIPGNEKLVYFHVNGVKSVIIICADFGLKNLHGLLDENHVELLLLPTGAGGGTADKTTDRELGTEAGRKRYAALLNNSLQLGEAAADCRKRKRGLAAVNQCGFDGKTLYHGGSGSIVSPFGELAAVIPGIINLDRPVPRFACGEIHF